MPESLLVHGNIQALPLVHGRLPFAVEVRRAMLAERHDVLAVELPPSLENAVLRAIDRLPLIQTVTYRHRPAFLEQEDDHLFYVPIDPCDGIIEALRIARRERTRIAFVDAEVEDFLERPAVLPDAHALHGLGLETWYRLVLPRTLTLARTAQDELREAHMAARLNEISTTVGEGRKILFLCGLAHWEAVRRHLESGTGRIHQEDGPPEEGIAVHPIHPRSLPHLLGEMPWITWRFEKHRGGIDPEPFDPTHALKDLLIEARSAYEKAFPDSLESATPQALRTLLRYLRKMVVRRGRLLPDPWALAVAAKGTVGNDFAVTLLETANGYPPNAAVENGLEMTADAARIDERRTPAVPRTPGEARSLRRLELTRRPEQHRAAEWRRGWNPNDHCSWPPEDVVIENFRAYVTRRALTLAGLSLRKTEPFTTSFKDGIAVRESLRDWHLGRIHVKEEPPVAGDVGALVTIFEEDDEGTKFPWRTTWMAEHEEESTLAFYATDPKEDMVGPGIGRMFYGGCLFLYPPMLIPDVWDDLRFEQARRPSERLLLAAIHYSREKFIAHLGPTPPAPEVQAQAQALGRHIVHLPASHFSRTTLERMRRAHVLGGRHVRSWASRFIS